MRSITASFVLIVSLYAADAEPYMQVQIFSDSACTGVNLKEQTFYPVGICVTKNPESTNGTDGTSEIRSCTNGVPEYKNYTDSACTLSTVDPTGTWDGSCPQRVDQTGVIYYEKLTCINAPEYMTWTHYSDSACTTASTVKTQALGNKGSLPIGAGFCDIRYTKDGTGYTNTLARAFAFVKSADGNSVARYEYANADCTGTETKCVNPPVQGGCTGDGDLVLNQCYLGLGVAANGQLVANDPTFIYHLGAASTGPSSGEISLSGAERIMPTSFLVAIGLLVASMF